jgi:hypothetical protein
MEVKTKPLWTESTIGLTTNEIRIYDNKTLDTRITLKINFF